MDRDEGEVSFSNDEDDGLAALFGGITPSAEPSTEPGPRRTGAVEPEPAPSETTRSEAPSAPPVQPQYQPPAYQPPAYPSPASPPPMSQPPTYQPPTSQPPTYQPPPAYEAPAPAAYPPPAPAVSAPPAATPPPASPPASAAYDLPAPAAAPQAPPSYDLPPPAFEPPAFEPPTYQPRAFEPPPSQEAPSYDLPAPGATPYAGPAPASPSYPPTAQYPAGLDPTLSPPAGPTYDPPASGAAPASPAPLDEPPPYAAPERRQTAAPGDGPYGGAPAVEGFVPPPAYPVSPPDPQPVERSIDDHPLVRAEPAAPATVFPPGPLLPSATVVETPEDLERSTAVEKVGLVLAVIAGPIGLVMAIVNAARSARRRGWLVGIVRASLVLGVLSSITAGVAGYVLWNMRLDQIAHAEITEASAEFCAAADVDPAMVTPPILGWPPEGASVSESITTMQAWTDRWTALAASSPAKLRTGMELLAATGQTIVDSVTQARVVDDATNQAQISAIAGQSGVADWHTTYCVAP